MLHRDELAVYCRERVASFKVPRDWNFVEVFPMTVTGKIQNYRMREAASEELRMEQAAGIATA